MYYILIFTLLSCIPTRCFKIKNFDKKDPSLNTISIINELLKSERLNNDTKALLKNKQ
jgi:hypothetical protein